MATGRHGNRASSRRQSRGQIGLRIRIRSKWPSNAVCTRRRSGEYYGCGVQIAIEIAVANPAMDRVAADAQLSRQRALARASLEVVPQEHSRLPSVHRASVERRMVNQSRGGERRSQPASHSAADSPQLSSSQPPLTRPCHGTASVAIPSLMSTMCLDAAAPESAGGPARNTRASELPDARAGTNRGAGRPRQGPPLEARPVAALHRIEVTGFASARMTWSYQPEAGAGRNETGVMLPRCAGPLTERSRGDGHP